MRRRRDIAAFAGALLLAAALACEPARAAPPPSSDDAPIVGVNRPTLNWSPAETRAATARAIAQAGIPAIRLGWSGPREAMRDALDQAARNNLGVLLAIGFLHDTVEPGRADAIRPGPGEPWGPRARLSALDLARYEAEVGRALDDIRASGVRLLAIQVGNEMNAAGFNGDLPLLRPGVGWPSVEAVPEPHRAAFEEGLRRYVGALRAARAARDARPALRGVPVVTAGLDESDDAWMRQTMGSAVAAEAVLRRLAELGAFDVADGVGNHAYGPFWADGRDPRPMLRRAWAECGAALVGFRPCWVSEFGGAADSPQACDLVEGRRVAQLDAAAEVARELGPRRVAAAFFYDWDDHGSRSLVRCGRVSEAARRLAEWARTGR